MRNRRNKSGKGRGPIIQPKEGDTKKMACAKCKEYRGLKWTWHTYVVPFIGSKKWKCNTCP